MPISVCAKSGCPNPATYRGRCQRHARQREREINRTGYSLYRSQRWKYTRRAQLMRQPLCEECGRIATDIHHRVDLVDGGNPWAPENLASLCRKHHSQITRKRQAA